MIKDSQLSQSQNFKLLYERKIIPKRINLHSQNSCHPNLKSVNSFSFQSKHNLEQNIWQTNNGAANNGASNNSAANNSAANNNADKKNAEVLRQLTERTNKIYELMSEEQNESKYLPRYGNGSNQYKKIDVLAYGDQKYNQNLRNTSRCGACCDSKIHEHLEYLNSSMLLQRPKTQFHQYSPASFYQKSHQDSFNIVKHPTSSYKIDKHPTGRDKHPTDRYKIVNLKQFKKIQSQRNTRNELMKQNSMYVSGSQQFQHKNDEIAKDQVGIDTNKSNLLGKISSRSKDKYQAFLNKKKDVIHASPSRQQISNLIINTKEQAQQKQLKMLMNRYYQEKKKNKTAHHKYVLKSNEDIEFMRKMMRKKSQFMSKAQHDSEKLRSMNIQIRKNNSSRDKANSQNKEQKDKLTPWIIPEYQYF